ncbi:MAG: BMP family ABC transporter substrate-binding protein [Mogibacterium sp.]|nr:BMP family ABC transporter substrate-binding protein [Mogibacterium sp.]
MMKKSMLKKIVALATGVIVAFALTMLLGGCKSEEEALPEENIDYEIALVTDDSLVMDGGHSETAWNAITEFGGTHGISHKYYKATEQTDAAYIEAIKAAKNKGAKVVIIDNSMMANAVYNMQEKYPEIDFVMLDASSTDPDKGESLLMKNTVAADFDSAQAGYLAGYAAVIDGSTELGFIGQSEAADIKAFGCGYVKGAERAAGELGTTVTMDYKYCDGTDREAVYKEAIRMYDDGAQVIFAAGSNVQDAVIEAAEAKDGKVIGSCTDQSGKSDTVITSAIYGLRGALKEILDGYSKGKFPGGIVLPFNASNEGIGLELKNNHLKNLTQAQYDAVYKSLASGEISINADRVESVEDIITVNLTFK